MVYSSSDQVSRTTLKIKFPAITLPPPNPSLKLTPARGPRYITLSLGKKEGLECSFLSFCMFGTPVPYGVVVSNSLEVHRRLENDNGYVSLIRYHRDKFVEISVLPACRRFPRRACGCLQSSCKMAVCLQYRPYT